MPTAIERTEVRRLSERGAVLVDVLPADDYESEHLQGAISIPLKQLNRATTAGLSQSQPIIVYCHDFQ